MERSLVVTTSKSGDTKEATKVTVYCKERNIRIALFVGILDFSRATGLYDQWSFSRRKALLLEFTILHFPSFKEC